jgi:hypothetical protein
LARGSGRGMALLGFVVQLPLALPPLASGVLLLFLLGYSSPLGRLTDGALTDSFYGIVLAEAFVAAPFLIIARAQLAGPREGQHDVVARDHCPLLGRAEPASHQSGCAFGEMRRGSAVPSHSRGRRWADSQSLKPHDCAKMRAAHADYRRRRAGSHRPGVSAMIAERQRPRGGQAAHAPVRKPTAAPRRVTTSE